MKNCNILTNAVIWGEESVQLRKLCKFTKEGIIWDWWELNFHVIQKTSKLMKWIYIKLLIHMHEIEVVWTCVGI